MTTADQIFTIFKERGQSAYLGEPVSQLEHALQAAHFAEQNHAPAPLIVAALLHDIGHLIEELPEDIAEQGIDARHEEIGHDWLMARFPPSVCDPVFLHVAAKRYLCATDTAYLGQLSPASVLSLKLQGGPMSPAEVSAFEEHEFFQQAVQLRRWDDQAKIEGLSTVPLSHYRELIEQTALASAAKPA